MANFTFTSLKNGNTVVSFELAESKIRPARKESIAKDILGTFAPMLINTLKRRREACAEKLRNHLNEAFTMNGGFSIAWKRKDGNIDMFNIPSYKVMEDAIRCLEQGNFDRFLNNNAYLDQTIKALLNDPELDHSDVAGIRFSTLVSLLMECLTCGAPTPASNYDLSAD